MGKNILFCLIIFTLFSCEKEKTISDELVGDWLYERETFTSVTTFEDPDTQGYISFKENETGNWTTSNGFLNFSLEWDLQSNDEKIVITKYVLGQNNFSPSITIYDLVRMDEDNFTFTFHLQSESPIDSIEGFEHFENIIITRMD